MIATEIVEPNITNFIHSLRDIGYSFEVAVADLIDNSISAKASKIEIYSVRYPDLVFYLLDDGFGMDELELVEAMRLSSKSPLDKREVSDLGRFGLGLKTASFSQCRKLTVISKKHGIISTKQWDLDYISKENKWLLITPEDLSSIPKYKDLLALKSGTLVCWETIDRIDISSHAQILDKLRKHLSLVFHRYLEGVNRKKQLKILVNENQVEPFDPFNLANKFTQKLQLEKVNLHNSLIKIQPYILPHHSKLTQEEYNLYATEEGYIKSQGFYLYRSNRILIHGTWWGLHKSLDAHKLVRIKIDIDNNMDELWGIDIKKSKASPCDDIRNDLKRIIGVATQLGGRPYIGRGRRIEDKTIIKVWDIFPINNELHFGLNRNHPLFTALTRTLTETEIAELDSYLKMIEAYLPLDAILYNLQANPNAINQEIALSEDDIALIEARLKSSNLTQDYIKDLLKTELIIRNPRILS